MYSPDENLIMYGPCEEGYHPHLRSHGTLRRWKFCMDCGKNFPPRLRRLRVVLYRLLLGGLNVE